MRKQIIRSLPAALAVLTLAAAPAIAQADPRPRHDHGLYVSIGHGGKVVFGYRERHYRSRYRDYQRVERKLVQKRARLVNSTQHAFSSEDFEETQRLLAKLVGVDTALREHRESHDYDHHHGTRRQGR
jgi:hypothetical protein